MELDWRNSVRLLIICQTTRFILQNYILIFYYYITFLTFNCPINYLYNIFFIWLSCDKIYALTND